MDQPIPPYLIALAVGDLAFQTHRAAHRGLGGAIGRRQSRRRILRHGENAGSGRETLRALPMDSLRRAGLAAQLSLSAAWRIPRLTFATPTVIAGDKSLVSLVAHEMAHSWSGNLVTNATWSDFWLNEGYTVYIERRILEEIYGPRRAEMEAALGYQDLQDELKSQPPADQILHIDLTGRDPDDGATEIPYEKGALVSAADRSRVRTREIRRLAQGVFRPFRFPEHHDRHMHRLYARASV